MKQAVAEEESTPWLALALVTALAGALRLIGLDSELWYDEILTVLESVRLPLSRIVTVFPGDNQHTFFSLLAHLSVGVFGEHPWSLRLPSVLLGVATVPLLYVFAREFVGRTEALLASLLLAVAYHHVWFSQSARGYAALAFFALLSSWLLLRGMRRRKPADWVWYGVAAALGVYTHLTMIFLVLSHALLCLTPLVPPRVERKQPRPWRLLILGFGLAAGFTLLLFAPVLLEVGQAVAGDSAPMASATPRWAARELWRGLQIGLGSGLAVLAGAALFLIGLWSYFRQSRFVVGMFLLPGVLTLAAAIALQRPVRPRFLFFLAGFALLIVVRGALELGRWLAHKRSPRPAEAPVAGLVLVGMMVLLSAAAVVVNSRYPKQAFEAAMRYVEAERSEGEPVTTAGGARYPYRRYYRRPWESLESLEELQTIRAGGNRVWVVYTLKAYIANRTPDLLRTLSTECTAARVFRGTVGDGDITVCTAPPVPAP
ncbi:MAG TPA: glycosyltransferase family 39 protein [Gemmatimonadales bacterium]|nr:glycosyltransferase family 39 protein [Gemmatimonadales bacterium]